MELQTAIEILEYHQEWRLGKREDMIYEPKKLTMALDIVLREVKKLNKADVVGQSEQLKCQCKKAQFTRTIDAHFNPLCGKCGRAL
jgi:Zn finger protein HypA/HybF involved in hydrogenase expression